MYLNFMCAKRDFNKINMHSLTILNSYLRQHVQNVHQ